MQQSVGGRECLVYAFARGQGAASSRWHRLADSLAQKVMQVMMLKSESRPNYV